MKIIGVTHGLLLASLGTCVFPSTLLAQSGFYGVPSVAISGIHDDNLFFDMADAKSDSATRVSPVLELGYESARSAVDVRYSFDAESYAQYTGLNSSKVRRFTDVGVRHQISRRLSFEADANYTQTNTPLDLGLLAGNALPGLLVGRMNAERIMLHPSLGISVSPTIDAVLAYTYTDDTLSDAFRSTTDMLEAEFHQRLSATSDAEYGYIHRRYSFDILATQDQQANGIEDQYSDTPWVGLAHRFSSATQLSGRVGPRIYKEQVNPYVLLSLRHTHAFGDFQLNYERNETTLLGEMGRHESKTLSAVFSHSVGSKLDLQLTPAYGRVSQENYAVDIYRAGLTARYRTTPYLHLTASYDLYYQQVGFVDGRADEVSRNVVIVGFYLTYPRREARRPR